LFPIRDVNPTSIRPILTWALIAVNAVIFFFVQPHDDLVNPGLDPEFIDFTYRNAAVACELTTGDPLDEVEVGGPCRDRPLGDPAHPGKNVWLAAGVSLFLHGGLAHLAFNMWSLWIFGNNVEEAFGRTGYLALYLAAGLAATAGFVIAHPDSTVPLIGASGAIAGVMGSYLVLFPRHRVLTLVVVWIVAIPAMVYLGIWLISQFMLAGGNETLIAWEAHVVGFAFGVLVTLPFRTSLLERLPAVAIGRYR
jgi:membrane associated rhomboid family serine protease